VHTALSFNVLGEDVLITGAGPIGIMAAAVVRHAGARYVVITDVNEYRLDLARRMKVSSGRQRKARVAPSPTSQKKLGMNEGFDVGLEMSGNQAAFREMMVQHERTAPSIAMLGIPRRRNVHQLARRGIQHAPPSKASTAARCTRPGTR
jgi:threonine 3-dehydrogenase